ncbi:hypothetical protein ACIGT4_18095 [Streptomyces sioyaensis]|uniref:hypothetical protein n=1 Tax=Streptomyces sioyaensis TaxID=67364 RepID=UPI0037CCE561
MKQSRKNLMAKGALAVLSIATVVAAGLLFVHPQSSAAPTLTLLVLTVTLTGVLRFAGWLGSSSHRSESSA